MSDIRTFKNADVFFNEGDSGSEAYLIASGSVEVSKIGPDKKKVVLAKLDAGNIFGEMSLICNLERSATVTALEDTAVIVISREGLEAVLNDNPQNLFSFLKKILHRLRYTNEMLMAFCGDCHHSDAHECITKSIYLTPVTKEAEYALQAKKIEITKIPFHIGRKTDDDTFDTRDLSLWDRKPFNISRHHCMITTKEDQYVLVDVDSTMGTEINGITLGKNGQKKSITLHQGIHRLTFGNPRASLFFNLEVP